MGLHVFPIPIPPPTSLSTRSPQVFPVHQVRALVSCIQPGLVIYTDNFESQIPHCMSAKFNNSTTPKHTHTYVNESHKNFQQVLASQMADSSRNLFL